MDTMPDTEKPSELADLQRQCERLRAERTEALAARDAALAERHGTIEVEVGARIADLRAEVERERAGARLAAQTARERDVARTERDGAVRKQNRLLAERDTTQTRVEEITRQWELTAALGTRRMLERDAVAVERDRLESEGDAALDERDQAARDRDAALAELDRAARAATVALEQVGPSDRAPAGPERGRRHVAPSTNARADAQRGGLSGVACASARRCGAAGCRRRPAGARAGALTRAAAAHRR
jgi:hypothetical protein